MKREVVLSMNNSGNNQHLCFYSNRCRWCEGFIKAISQTPYKAEFKFICVDPQPNGARPPLPKWLKKVPTLVIRGEDEPRTDSGVMNWLAERQLMDNKKGGGPSEPEPWVGNEMGGSFTKGFSFLGANDTNEAPMGNFEFLNGQNSVGSRTGSDLPPGGLGARQQTNKSKKEQLFDNQMESYMKQRNEGMPLPPNRQ
jgi:hypothetical protein